MKKYIHIAAFVALVIISNTLNAQTLNWNTVQNSKHFVNANIGLEHGAIYGIGYGRRISSGLFPAILNAEYSFPSGEKILDDFKVKIGGQVRLIQVGDFNFSTRIQGVFRREQNGLARLMNFGSDMAGIAGYYRDKWFVAGEVGFDKAIVTHLKHSDSYKDQYPGVADGWFDPPTGGNFYYGLQTGLSFKNSDLYIRAGKILTQDFKTAPMVPFYGQLGYNVKF